MDRLKLPRGVQIQASETLDRARGEGQSQKISEASDTSGELKPFMGVKVRRRASLRRDCKGDYLDVPSDPYLSSMLSKRGDQKVLFADKVLKFTGSGKIKQCIMLITECAIYIVDPDADVLKRRMPLATVDKICLSKLSDNFFAIIVPSEYDCLMASTRKTEIVSVLVEATKGRSDYEVGVVFSNRFEYHASANMVKEVHFEEAEGGIKTRIAKKTS
ncbi:myosin IB heavy chain-like [Phoenix dactylifera]|uniref:Myosin IB heavy chain-like n=1 Tax=Phoenix dactylifera TaxID=42345 RepID=A0A8B7CAE3_PHODC|nr:myosin IB heavy chain-like [Phoenix dactylifera]